MMLNCSINMLLKQVLLKGIKNKYLKASITVEASISFTVMIFVLFMMLGPLFIIKTTSDIIEDLNTASKKRCIYEMVKNDAKDSFIYDKIINFTDKYNIHIDNISNVEDIFDYALIIANYIKKHQSEEIYNNVRFAFPISEELYNEETGIVKYDFVIDFKIPYNVLHLAGIDTRLVINRRAFIGADENRFSEDQENSEYVYIADNYVNEHIYHTNALCHHLEKKTSSMYYDAVKNETNANGHKYSKCDYCYKNVKLSNNSIVYITVYGERFHNIENCPKMTAYVKKVLLSELDTSVARECYTCMKNKIKEG